MLNLSTASAVRRSVVFGSPEAAEFNKTSPTTSFTPLDKAKAKSLFSMSAIQQHNSEQEAEAAASASAEVDPVTKDNDSILEEWDRLTNASGSDSSEGSDDEHSNGMDVQSSPDAFAGARSNGFCANSSSRRRRSMLQPEISLAPSPSPSESDSSFYSQQLSRVVDHSASPVRDTADARACTGAGTGSGAAMDGSFSRL